MLRDVRNRRFGRWIGWGWMSRTSSRGPWQTQGEHSRSEDERGARIHTRSSTFRGARAVPLGIGGAGRATPSVHASAPGLTQSVTTPGARGASARVDGRRRASPDPSPRNRASASCESITPANPCSGVLRASASAWWCSPWQWSPGRQWSSGWPSSSGWPVEQVAGPGAAELRAWSCPQCRAQWTCGSAAPNRPCNTTNSAINRDMPTKVPHPCRNSSSPRSSTFRSGHPANQDHVSPGAGKEWRRANPMADFPALVHLVHCMP